MYVFMQSEVMCERKIALPDRMSLRPGLLWLLLKLALSIQCLFRNKGSAGNRTRASGSVAKNSDH
jgi:hypothetical protein